MTLTLQDRLDRIVQWAHERNLIEGGTVEAQRLKLIEGAGETAAAILRNNRDGIRDGIGDMVVVLVILAEMQGFKHNWDVAMSYGSDIQLIGWVMEFSDSAFVLDDVATLAHNHNLTLAECLDAAWDEIKDRKGRMVDGVFIKEGDS